ncbi:MAG: bifunctional folylpolyglutamate synthase/ dihydrofolate synthase [Desulfovibrio sp.]|nr:bifunctional folylpolyglutamate synthase/ dihydrofolate synthase [Desulfovibrio sp.]
MKAFFHSYDEIATYLDARGCFHMDMSLGRMEKTLARLALRRPPFRVIQVIGTNGKGSTSSFLSSICRAHGLATGLYTSPHFVEPTERIQINGLSVPGQDWVEPANRLLSVAQDLTYFEFLTVLALMLFQKAAVDIAVLEAGLGGRHDATTAVDADLLCFTPIAMDHCDVLGDSLETIAHDKADAIRGGTAVCSAQQKQEVRPILQEKARKEHAPLVFAGELPEDGFPAIGLAGRYQRVNAGLALAAWRVLAPMLGRGNDDVNAQRRGIAEAFLPGRFQRVRGSGSFPPLVLDGAHNPHGTQALAAALKSERVAPSSVIYSCLRDKDWRSSVTILKNVLKPGTGVFVPQMDNSRAEDAAIVASYWKDGGYRAEPVGGPDAVERAVKAAFSHDLGGGKPVLITGSLYLLSAFFGLYPQLLSNSSSGGGE